MRLIEKIFIAIWFGLCVLVVCLAITEVRTEAQGPPVMLMTAPASSTLTNCGTPTVPALCIVTTGVYVWQSTTTGWFLIPSSVAATGVQKVNGAAPGATGNVTVGCSAAIPGAVSTPTVTSSGATATIA